MIVVKPVVVTDSNLVSSTIPEPDASQGEILWTAGTYNTGDRRVEGHRIYEVVADPSTTDQPSVGAKLDPPTWFDVAPTNRFAMFDTVNSTVSIGGTQLVVEIDDPTIINAVSGFSISGATAINIQMDDPVEGIVYNQDIEMVDNSEVTDWYNYYFSPIIRISQFSVINLPAYVNASVIVTIDGVDVEIGTLVMGRQFMIGTANHGTSVQLLDFSRKETDDFGNIVVTQGRTSKLVDFDVSIDKSKVNYVFDLISSITTVPAVWIGADDSDDPTLVYGYYRDFQDNISSPTITDATIQIEGLV